MALPAGTRVPEFSLGRDDGEPFTRADLDGETTVLVFYPFAFSPVCTDQLQVYDDALDELTADGAVLIGVSCDSVHAQRAFREKLGVSIELLSDFEPKGAACRAFDVLHPGGFPQRALVVVGPDATVAWSHQAATPGDLPGLGFVREGLAAARAAA